MPLTVAARRMGESVETDISTMTACGIGCPVDRPGEFCDSGLLCKDNTLRGS